MIPKEIMKLYEKLAFSRGYEEAFRDFLDVCLYYLSVGMLAEDYRRVEKRYKPYEMELFVHDKITMHGFRFLRLLSLFLPGRGLDQAV